MENIPAGTGETVHTTVLLHESIDGLGIQPGDVYLDGTLGGAGHAEYVTRIAEQFSAPANCPKITIVGLDEDEDALARAKVRLEKSGQLKDDVKLFLVKENFRHLDRALDSIGMAQANRIMLDLGLSSDQFETSGRGFSFKKDEPLLMTFARPVSENSDSSVAVVAATAAEKRLTARDIVNTWDEANIADIIYGYGEEKFSRHIAKGIVEVRAVKPIETTFDLVAIIEKSTPSRYHHGKIHPATRTFQALRITVNDEINALREGLAKGFERLAPGGRMAVISFHSIEDRIVKHFYKEKKHAGIANILTKKPTLPSHQEISENPRSRSAKLRIIEKIS